jgi:hypothetical protein
MDLDRVRADELICHYTRADTALEILHSKMIRLNVLAAVNDPRETVSRRFEMSEYVGSDATCEQRQADDWLIEQLDELFTRDVKIFCATRDSQVGADVPRRLRGFARPRMWAQYGDRHRGACLVFDREKLTSSLVRASKDFGVPHLLADVRYDATSLEAGRGSLTIERDQFASVLSARSDAGLRETWIEHAEKHQHGLFFNKHEDWEAESEWRFVMLDRSSGFLTVPFEDALVSVVLGCETPNGVAAAITRSAATFRLKYESWKEDYLVCCETPN